MSDTPTLPLRTDLLHLRPSRPSFWRWSGDAQWLEWSDGKTIAHRDELRVVLSRLAPQGLPDLDAVLLVLAAAKAHWQDDRVDLIVGQYAADRDLPNIVDAVLARRLRTEVGDLFQKLQAVHELPDKLRDSAAAKASLVDFIFKGDRPIAPAVAEQIVAELVRGPEADFVREPNAGDGLGRFSRALESLGRGLDDVAGDAVARWQRTGIDFDLAEADVKLPPARQVRTLLRALRGDDELAGLARVAADVLAVVHVPRALSPEHDLPGGGVSDLANKGNLDQLLLSELAHDDLTLTVRVAMGEALYLRREPPARRPPVGRTLVIDGGIRLWGTARLFATAIALALAADADERATLRVFRANDEKLEPVRLTDRAGLTDHLAALAVSPNPLPAAKAAARAFADADAEASELVLITQEQFAAEPGIAAALSSLATDRLTVRLATVTADGDFLLTNVASGVRSPVAHAKLSPEKLVRHSTARSAELVADVGLPDVLRLTQFPLLLPAILLPHQAAYTAATGVVGMTTDRRLMQWTAKNLGGRELTDRLPPGTPHAVFVRENEVIVVVARGLPAGLTANVLVKREAINGVQVVVIDLASGRQRTVDLGPQIVQHVTMVGDALLLICPNTVITLLPGSPTPGGYDRPDGLLWLSGRYFRDSERALHAATATGFVRAASQHRGLIYFDHDTLGPVRMENLGRFEPIDDKPVLVLPDLLKTQIDLGTVAVSADGHRVIACEQAKKDWIAVDLSTGQSKRVRNRNPANFFLLGPEVADFAFARETLQRRVGTIARTAGGLLVLRPDREPQQFMLDSRGVLRLARVPGDAFELMRTFVRVPGPPGSAIELKKATWSDGSSAWLDGRGLLHLVSSDPIVPQLTLVLPNPSHAVAGWSGEMGPFGPTYFTGKPVTDDGRVVADIIRQFALRLLP